MNQFISRFTDKTFQKEMEKRIEINDMEAIDELISAQKQMMIEKYPPEQCLHGLKIVKDGIQTFNENFRIKVKDQLLDHIYEVAMYRIMDQDDVRGTTYFKNPEHEKRIESVGASYIRLALDCIRVWGDWFQEFRNHKIKLEQTGGYLPQITYFKPEIIQKYQQKVQEGTPTPQDETLQIKMKVKQLNEQLTSLLQKHINENDLIMDELAKINAQLEDILLLDVQDQFVDDFIVSYSELTEKKKSYYEFKQQFLNNQQMKMSQEYFNSQANDLPVKSTIKVEQQQQQQQSQYSQSQSQQLQQSQQYSQQQQMQQSQNQQNQQHLQQQKNLQEQLFRQQQETQTLKVDYDMQLQLNEEQKAELQDLQKRFQQLQLQNQQLQKQINEDKHYYQTQLQEQQNVIEEISQKYQSAQQRLYDFEQNNIPQNNNNPLGNSHVVTIQNLQEELENLRVERNLLVEQKKEYESKSQQQCSQYDYMILKKKYDELDSKYFLLKQENFKLRSITQNMQNVTNHSVNQSRINESINKELDFQQEITNNSNVVFLNLKDSDLWSTYSTQKLVQPAQQMQQNKEISHLIFPHKTAAEYYRAQGKKQFRGNLVDQMPFQIQMNQANILNFKKASLNQLALLYQTNKIEIKSKYQMVLGANKQEFISTTLSIKNRELKPVQIQIINSNKNVWINKEAKSVVLQSQQQVLYEFIREANVRFHEATQLYISVSFENLIFYLPNFLVYCIKYLQIEVATFQQIKKHFAGKIFKTALLPIQNKAELMLLAQKGQILNQIAEEEQINEKKYGFKAILTNQFEFYLELIITPCDEFLFRGFTSFDEETLQFVLNSLSYLYS